MRGAISKSGGNASLAGGEPPEGRVSAARWNPKGMRRSTGPQSRERSRMNRSAKDGARSSLHYGGEGVLIHPSYQGVCGRHGTEDQSVTPGGLVEFLSGDRISDPISEERSGKRGSASSRTAE
jgi:hypothetical protein